MEDQNLDNTTETNIAERKVDKKNSDHTRGFIGASCNGWSWVVVLATENYQFPEG